MSARGEAASPELRVEAATCVVVASVQEQLDHALTVAGTELRQISPRVAVSELAPDAVARALRAAGVQLIDDAPVATLASAATQPNQPALPHAAQDAIGPRAIRALLHRATAEQRQLRLEYFASSRGGAATDRVVDPWTFDGGLLRGYCHLRQDERTFALDRVGRARLLPTAVQHGPPAEEE